MFMLLFQNVHVTFSVLRITWDVISLQVTADVRDTSLVKTVTGVT